MASYSRTANLPTSSIRLSRSSASHLEQPHKEVHNFVLLDGLCDLLLGAGKSVLFPMTADLIFHQEGKAINKL